jgi:exodeoxyribonuclease V gamma subunit
MLSLHHSNSLNKLAEILQVELARGSSGENILQAQNILVQNPGMKRWLQQQISVSTGIAANINFPLPSRFIWDIFSIQFDDVDSFSSYDAEVLRWSLMTILQDHIQEPALAVLKPYLQQDDHGQARFQLAQKLAGLFDQYQVYRPDMIARWQQGNATQSTVEAWQAYLWCLIRDGMQQPHRAQLITRLIHHLNKHQQPNNKFPKRVFVFAISAMSPMYMKVLNALAAHIDVHIFILNPCEYYWGDIESKKEQINKRSDPSGALIDDNELLASLGKQGREFIDQFYDDIETPQENSHFVDITPDSLLKRIQFDILKLDQEPVDHVYHDDKSIQLVSCYSELRELQVLHDRLLDLLAADESLQAHDIVVMCPDIDALAPYVEAVFGMQPEHKRIPFSISDNNVLVSQPMVQAIIDWLRLPASRFTAHEIIGWLELPPLQRAYQLQEQDIDVLRYWLRSTHIHWGLNRAHKKAMGLGDNNLNTWSHGIGQLLTAYLMNGEVDFFAGNLAAATVISSEEFYALGQLQKLLDDLGLWSNRLKEPQTLEQWQNTINSLINNFLVLDEDEEWLLKTVREQFAKWQQQASLAGFGEALDAALISQILQNELQQNIAGHHYLNGAVNFCNLIPMRTLPFSVVCLIGMGDDRFPRNEVPMHLDLMSMHPRKGDRSRREDDRYMFLQSILSAQEKLYISYVGRNKKDDSITEPSVVVCELLDQVEKSCEIKLPVEKTALQPFSYRNYEQGSYSELWQLDQLIAAETFDQPISAIDPGESLMLEEMISFFRNPAKYFMHNRLNLSLTEYNESSDDDENFTLDPLTRYGVNRDLLEDLVKDGEINPVKHLSSGVLAQQNVGVLQLREQTHQIETLFHNMEVHDGFNGEHCFDIKIQIEGMDISGRIPSFSSTGFLKLSLSRCKGSSLLPMWIEYCVLCAIKGIQFNELHFQNEIIVFAPLSIGQAQDYLGQLIQLYRQGQQQLLPFYVDTAYEYESVKQKRGEQEARQKVQELWSGDGFVPFFESHDSYILTAMKNQTEWPSQFYHLASQLMGPVLASMSIVK